MESRGDPGRYGLGRLAARALKLGIGDEIMAAGEARRLQAVDPRPVAIVDRRGRARWHRIWQGNPRIATPAQVASGLTVQRHVNCGGARPYLEAVTRERFDYRRDWRPTPAEIVLTEDEAAFAATAAGALLVEPQLKASASPNKRWPWARWQALVTARPDLPWVQVGPRGTPRLAGLRFIETRDFRLACAVLARARAAVLPEGGLHHAAAALGVPAVVIYGGFVSPAITGYDGQVAFYRPHRDDGDPCGLRVSCPACRSAMAHIGVEEVLEALERLL